MSEISARNARIIQSIQDGDSYGDIGKRFRMTRQGIQQIRKRAEEAGVVFHDQRKVGRPQGSGTIKPAVQRAIRLLCQYPDATYDELCKNHDVTRSQLAAGYQRAKADRIVLKDGKERQGESLYSKMLPDLKDKNLSRGHIATKHGTTPLYVSQCIARARRTGENIPYRREPLQPVAVRKAVENAVKDERCLSVDQIAQEHTVPLSYVRGVITRLRQAGESVPCRKHLKEHSSKKPQTADK
ncbi:MAG: hypothetical protein ACXAC5_01770 [Promethearchaeota archaeon]|jgi:transposase